MHDHTANRLVDLARHDLEMLDIRRAKDRLRTVLWSRPHHRPALQLLGRIYLSHGDLRNAVTYLSRADCWDEPIQAACERIFRIIARELAKDNMKGARYYLYAFSGSNPPAEISHKLSSLRSAYYVLEYKKLKRSGIACAPIAGGCLLGLLGVFALALGTGWAWFVSLGLVALITTAIVTGLHVSAYLHASRRFQEALSPFLPPE